MEPIEDAGEVPAPLYAWRCYKVYRDDYGAAFTPLYYNGVDVGGHPIQYNALATNYATIDLLGWNTADAKPRAYDEFYTDNAAWQQRENRQGIHAFHGKGQAIKYAIDYISQYTNRPSLREVVITKIELQGEIIEHEMGYRAEKARVIEIHAGGTDEQRAELANLLGWPFDIHECDMIPYGPVETSYPPFVQIAANIAHMTEKLMEAGETARKVSVAVQAHLDRYDGYSIHGAERRLYLKLRHGLHIPEVKRHILYCAAIYERRIAADWGYFDPGFFKQLAAEIGQDWLHEGFFSLQLLTEEEILDGFSRALNEMGILVDLKRYNHLQARNMGYHDGKYDRPALVLQHWTPDPPIQVNIAAETSQFRNDLRMQMLYGGSSFQKPDLGPLGI